MTAVFTQPPPRADNQPDTTMKLMPADIMINHRTVPDYGSEAMCLMGGIDHVVKVGSRGMLKHLYAVEHGSEIVLVRLLTQGGNPSPRAMMFKGASLCSSFIGSSAMAQSLNAAVNGCGTRPIVDRGFDLGDAVSALVSRASPG